MSIINDALKKAQDQLEKNKSKTKSQPPEDKKVNKDDSTPAPTPPAASLLKKNPPPPTPKTMYKKPSSEVKKDTPAKKDTDSKSTPWKTPVKIVALLALLGTIYFFGKDHLPDNIPSLPSKAEKPTGKIKPLVKRSFKAGELILSGTSSVEGQEFAIINDDLYQVGDMVDGKKIIKIEIKKVELLDAEGTTTLLSSK